MTRLTWSGSYTLADVRTKHLGIVCDKCQRKGRLLTAKLIADFGAGRKLPDLLADITERAGCEKHRADKIYDRCQAHYDKDSIIRD